jgi:hypothetical protein
LQRDCFWRGNHPADLLASRSENAPLKSRRSRRLWVQLRKTPS